MLRGRRRYAPKGVLRTIGIAVLALRAGRFTPRARAAITFRPFWSPPDPVSAGGRLQARLRVAALAKAVPGR